MTNLKLQAAMAGYIDRIDIQRLHADLIRQPGCEGVKLRTLANYVAGVTQPKGAILVGLSVILDCSVIDLIEVEDKR